MNSILPKIIVILGPTASGKTQLSIELARRFNGEIISADSRQVYTKMTIGTAKPLGVWQTNLGRRTYMVEGVPHYLMDMVDPATTLTVADFKEQALRIIYDIQKRGEIPFIVGGTGLYAWSLVDNLDIPAVAPDKKIRQSLEGKTLPDLQDLLQQLDPEAFTTIDSKNPRRIIRALEVAMLTGESFVHQRRAGLPLFEVLQIGIRWPLPELYQRIEERVEEQMARGLVAETVALIKEHYDSNLPSMSSIGYAQVISYLRGECTLPEVVRSIKTATRQYAKRQMTWFRRDKRIQWMEGPDLKAAVGLVEKFL